MRRIIFFSSSIVTTIFIQALLINPSIGECSETCSPEKTFPAVSEQSLNSVPQNLKLLWKAHPNCEFLAKLINHYDIFLEIYSACGNSFLKGCGSYLFDGTTYTYCELMYEKQKLLYEAAKKSTHALEVGVYMGHSILIMLLANPDLQITGIDIDDRYSKPALKLIETKLNTKINFIKNDSFIALPKLDQKFDLFHIDSSHDVQHVSFEIAQCIAKRSQSNIYVVIDDYDCYRSYLDRFFIDNAQFSVLNRTVPNCAWCNFVAELEFH
jgi:hypothetical protein